VCRRASRGRSVDTAGVEVSILQIPRVTPLDFLMTPKADSYPLLVLVALEAIIGLVLRVGPCS